MFQLPFIRIAFHIPCFAHDIRAMQIVISHLYLACDAISVQYRNYNVDYSKVEEEVAKVEEEVVKVGEEMAKVGEELPKVEEEVAKVG